MSEFGKIALAWENGGYNIPSHCVDDIKVLKFVNKSNNPNPEIKDPLNSGFDLRAWITEDDKGGKQNEDGLFEITLKSFEIRMIHTGLYFDLPECTEIQVRPRSGLAINYGITVINTPATVDEGYTGEVCVLLINLSKQKFTIKNGDRIAQGVLCPVFNGRLLQFEEMEKIEKITERGKEGFGHSGIE